MYKENAILLIKKSFNENNNSHVFLIVTNNKENALRDIKQLIIDILVNLNEESKNQIINENYMEMIITRMDGTEIKKEQIQNIMDKIKKKPIISNYIIDIILDADKMNDRSSNMLLKTLEEPDESVLHFLIVSDINKVLKTIQSRCEVYNLNYINEEEKYDSSLYMYAKDLIKLLESNNLTEFHIYLNQFDTMDYKTILNMIANLYYEAAINDGSKNKEIINIIRQNNTHSRLINKAFYLNKNLNNLNIKVTDDILLDKIFIELNEVI